MLQKANVLHHLEPRGRPPAGPYHNTGVAREQKNFELVKLFNDIEGLAMCQLEGIAETDRNQPLLCLLCRRGPAAIHPLHGETIGRTEPSGDISFNCKDGCL